jgi:DNA (cytosine-5)-methyltransferase 1
MSTALNLEIISLFSGAGGLDFGFKKAGFKIIYANEYDKKIRLTLEHNFPNINLDQRDIRKIHSDEIPNCIGIIGGPPCQSWSEAGSLRGINDSRGKLFFNYIEIINDKKPLFFVIENVSGILHARNKEIFSQIIKTLENIGYNVKYKLLNAKNYNVPQDRERVFIIGFLNNINFEFPKPIINYLSLKDAIFDLKENAKIYNPNQLDDFNHEYYISGFSTIFMSRNRVRNWEEQSFTIQAGARHIPLHPQAPKMELIEKDKRIFSKGNEHLYRRFSVRECARIQTFPDDFKFIYTNILDGYKMVGNAVPVNLSYEIAKQILKYII